MERETLHFDFSHLRAAGDLTLHVAGAAVKVVAHDSSSRQHAQNAIPLLKLIPERHLTHYAEVELPSDAVALIWVTTPKEENGVVLDAPVHMAVHVPAASRAHARESVRRSPGTVHGKLQRFGVTPETFAAAVGDQDDPRMPEHIHTMQDAFDAALATLFHHPSLINLAHEHAAFIREHITDALSQLQDMQAAIYDLGDGWLITTNTNPNVNPPWPHTKPHRLVIDAAQGALARALVATQNDPRLKGQQWNQQYGITEKPYHSRSSQPAHANASPHVFAAAARSGDRWVAKNVGSTWGLDVDTTRQQVCRRRRRRRRRVLHLRTVRVPRTNSCGTGIR